MAQAYDTSSKSNTSSSATSLTWAHTCTGTDPILYMAAWWNASRTVTSFAYNGSNGTALGSAQATGAERFNVYYLVAPSTGANNIVLTFSGTADIEGIGASYTGSSQSSPIDVATLNITSNLGVTSLAMGITTTVANTYSTWAWREYAGRTITAGANTAYRQKVTAIYGLGWADSGAVISSAGLYTMNLNASASANFIGNIMSAFKAPTTVNSGFLTFI